MQNTPPPAQTTATEAPINPRTGKPLSMSKSAIAQREYRARKRAEKAAQQGKTPTEKGTNVTDAKQRIADLEAKLARAEARAEKAEASRTVMWSCRVPAALREQVRPLQHGKSVQQVTAEALRLWIEANTDQD